MVNDSTNQKIRLLEMPLKFKVPRIAKNNLNPQTLSADRQA